MACKFWRSRSKPGGFSFRILCFFGGVRETALRPANRSRGRRLVYDRKGPPRTLPSLRGDDDPNAKWISAADPVARFESARLRRRLAGSWRKWSSVFPLFLRERSDQYGVCWRIVCQLCLFTTPVFYVWFLLSVCFCFGGRALTGSE